MKIRKLFLSVSLAAVAGLVSAGASFADGHEGEEMTVHNKTGHEVLAFLLQDDHPHLDEAGGVQFGHLKNGESAVAHVPNCHFGIILVDHEDVWHAEFHDCHSTDLTFTMETGHAKKAKH